MVPGGVEALPQIIHAFHFVYLFVPGSLVVLTTISELLFVCFLDQLSHLFVGETVAGFQLRNGAAVVQAAILASALFKLRIFS